MMAAERSNMDAAALQAHEIHKAPAILGVGEHEPLAVLRLGDYFEMHQVLQLAKMVLAATRASGN